MIYDLNLDSVGYDMKLLSMNWHLQLCSYKHRTTFSPIVPSIKYIPIQYSAKRGLQRGLRTPRFIELVKGI